MDAAATDCASENDSEKEESSEESYEENLTGEMSAIRAKQPITKGRLGQKRGSHGKHVSYCLQAVHFHSVVSTYGPYCAGPDKSCLYQLVYFQPCQHRTVRFGLDTSQDVRSGTSVSG